VSVAYRRQIFADSILRPAAEIPGHAVILEHEGQSREEDAAGPQQTQALSQ
jgi:hypothetical protein